MYRQKSDFSAGEISPLMALRTDQPRHAKGCRILKNMYVTPQGPVVNRTGFQHIWSLSDLGQDTFDKEVAMIPFIFSETEAYVIVIFKHTSGVPRAVFVQDDYMVGAPTPIYLDLPGFDIENFDYAQSSDVLYIATGSTNPHSITRLSALSFSWNSLAFTSQPAEWGPGAADWPETVTFYQGRLVFGGSLNYPQRIWTSKAGNFLDFTTGTAASDAIVLDIDAATQNRIRWMSSTRGLLVGTAEGEWLVTGTDIDAGLSAAPGGVTVRAQSHVGGEHITPVQMGTSTVFIERLNRGLIDMTYRYEAGGYVNTNLSILAPHLTERSGIDFIAYQQSPHSILWCQRDDGVLIALTYDKNNQIVAWHQHTTGVDDAHQFKCVACIPNKGNREDDLFVIVRRGTEYFIEVKYQSLVGEDGTASGDVLLDSSYTYRGAYTNNPGGFDHLIGKTVSVLVNGSPHPDVTVNGDGTIDLNRTGSRVTAGYAYTSEVRPYTSTMNLQDGPSTGRTQRITDLTIVFYRTLGGYIGREDSEDGESEEEILFRVPGDLTGQELPLFSGEKRVAFPEGYDTDAEYFIRQKQPLPMTVVGVIEKLEVYE